MQILGARPTHSMAFPLCLHQSRRCFRAARCKFLVQGLRNQWLSRFACTKAAAFFERRGAFSWCKAYALNGFPALLAPKPPPFSVRRWLRPVGYRPQRRTTGPPLLLPRLSLRFGALPELLSSLSGLFPALPFCGFGLHHREAEESQGLFLEGVILAVVIGGELHALELEGAVLTHVFLVHMNGHDFRQEHIVGTQFRDFFHHTFFSFHLSRFSPERTPQKSAAFTKSSFTRLMTNSFFACIR